MIKTSPRTELLRRPLVDPILGQVVEPRKTLRRTFGWLADPRSAVLLTLGSVVVVGGGRRLAQAWNARRAIARLDEPEVTPAEIVATAQFGRAGLRQLFEILATSTKAELREAAGKALSILWTQDELIAEEEKALVLRGFKADWQARRRYPRRLQGPIPISVSYGVPFLNSVGEGNVPPRLEWAHRILGAERVSLEEFTPWKPGLARAEFTILPADYASNGPHRLALHAKVRSVESTSRWELDLPHLPFQFELDPLLEVGSLRTMPDEHRAAQFDQSVSLETENTEAGASTYLVLNDDFALRNPPRLIVQTPLPSDLAHTIAIEFEGIPSRFAAGSVVVSGQGTAGKTNSSTLTFPLQTSSPVPNDQIRATGEQRIRVVLTPSDELGWADPAIRSIWPGEISTDWVLARVVRR